MDSTCCWIMPGLLVLRGSLKGGERAVPELVEVGPQDRQSRRIDLVEPPGPLLAIDDQASFLATV